MNTCHNYYHTFPCRDILDEGGQEFGNCTCVWSDNLDPDPPEASGHVANDVFDSESPLNPSQTFPAQVDAINVTWVPQLPITWVHEELKQQQVTNTLREINYSQSPAYHTSELTLSLHTTNPTTSFEHLLSTTNNNDQPTQNTPPSPSLSKTSLDDTAIGSFHISGKFKCTYAHCTNYTFGRLAELRRHYDTMHAPQKPEFWCNVPLCERSAAAGGRPFRREDKSRDHVRQKHRGVKSRIRKIARRV